MTIDRDKLVRLLNRLPWEPAYQLLPKGDPDNVVPDLIELTDAEGNAIYFADEKAAQAMKELLEGLDELREELGVE